VSGVTSLLIGESSPEPQDIDWESIMLKRALLVAVVMGPVLAGCMAEDEAASPGNRFMSGSLSVPMFKITAAGQGEQIGALVLMDSRGGLRIEPSLGGLPPGAHGIHIHDKGDCGPAMKDGKLAAGVAAGGHFDPAATGKHDGPTGNGHKGDLPVLDVDAQGNATAMVQALHLSLNDVRGRAIVIHANGDNYSDQPKPLGGGGERIACGVVPGGE
jgi:Cu-Zn family superoxide dismutase